MAPFGPPRRNLERDKGSTLTTDKGRQADKKLANFLGAGDLDFTAHGIPSLIRDSHKRSKQTSIILFRKQGDIIGWRVDTNEWDQMEDDGPNPPTQRTTGAHADIGIKASQRSQGNGDLLEEEDAEALYHINKVRFTHRKIEPRNEDILAACHIEREVENAGDHKGLKITPKNNDEEDLVASGTGDKCWRLRKDTYVERVQCLLMKTENTNYMNGYVPSLVRLQDDGKRLNISNKEYRGSRSR